MIQRIVGNANVKVRLYYRQKNKQTDKFKTNVVISSFGYPVPGDDWR